MREISDKLEKMEKKYTDLEKQLVEKDNVNRNLGVEMDSKIEAFQSKLLHLVSVYKKKMMQCFLW